MFLSMLDLGLVISGLSLGLIVIFSHNSKGFTWKERKGKIYKINVDINQIWHPL